LLLFLGGSELLGGKSVDVEVGGDPSGGVIVGDPDEGSPASWQNVLNKTIKYINDESFIKNKIKFHIYLKSKVFLYIYEDLVVSKLFRNFSKLSF
jgi:hypothetical protein